MECVSATNDRKWSTSRICCVCTKGACTSSTISTIKKCHMQCWWWYDMRVVCFSHHHFTIIIVILWTRARIAEKNCFSAIHKTTIIGIEKNIMTTQQFIISYIETMAIFFRNYEKKTSTQIIMEHKREVEIKIRSPRMLYLFSVEMRP